MALVDPHLLSAARAHNPDAWNTLLRQYHLPLYTYVAEMLRDDTASLDVVQKTFTAAALREARPLVTNWVTNEV